MLAVVDEFVSVSRFTQKKIEYIHLISSSKSSVINNCIDPYLDDNVPQLKINALKNKFNLSESDKIIFTLTRLSKEDRKKGCENVLKALKKVKEYNENVKYIIGGSVEHDEKNILLELASSLDLSDSLIFADFIPNEELGAYYLLSDVFILSSYKEGFGIVFAEAMFFGTPVIGGNQDGSMDALCDGELGTLINPSDVSSIEDALINVLKDTENFLPDRNLLLSKFSFEKYKSNWSDLLNKSKNLN